MLGIIIGVGAVIAMVSIGNGAKAQVEAQIASLGAERDPGFFRQRHPRRHPHRLGQRRHADRRGRRGHPARGARRDRRSARRSAAARQIAAGNENWNTQILGECADYFTIRQWPLAAGRDVHRPGRARRHQGRRHRQDDRRPTVSRRRSRRPDPPHPERAVHRLSACFGPKACPSRARTRTTSSSIPYTSAMKRLLGATMLRVHQCPGLQPPCSLSPAAGTNRRPAPPAPSHHRRARMTISPCATSRKSPTPQPPQSKTMTCVARPASPASRSSSAASAS